MTERVRVGTRRSRLALVQTESVMVRLAGRFPAIRFETVPIETSGDRDPRPGGSPDFTDAIDRALTRGEIDLAVHSAKDLDSRLASGLELAACCRRADPRDCLVVRAGLSPLRLPRGARVGSSSLRRRAQLLRQRADLDIVEIRGNVDTRIGLVRSGKVDAVILAVAGLTRLGRTREIGRILSTRSFLPAPAQGALAVVIRENDRSVRPIVETLDHCPTRAAVVAERAFSAALGGDCRVPLAALASARGRSLSLVGEVLSSDGIRHIRASRRGPSRLAEELGRSLAKSVLAAGGAEILASRR